MEIQVSRKSKFFCLVMGLIMIIGVFLSAGTSVYASDNLNNIMDEREKYSKVSEENLSNMLSTLESIPDSVLESGDAIKANSYLDSLKETTRYKRGAWECGLAIAGLIVTTAVPVAKLVKIKKLVKALGGGVQAAKIIFGASLASEKWAALGGAAKDLVLELIGITGVKEKCFG